MELGVSLAASGRYRPAEWPSRLATHLNVWVEAANALPLEVLLCVKGDFVDALLDRRCWLH